MQIIVEFTKMNGAGNDFIVIDNRFYHFSDEELSGFAQRLCPRRKGIGADGLLAFNSPDDAGHDFRMHYFNADGTIGTMCGNGARCLVLFARRAGMDKPEMWVETDAGVLQAEGSKTGRCASTSMRWPAIHRTGYSAAMAETDVADAHYIWTGTEHLVCFADRVADIPVGVWGPAIGRTKHWPRPAPISTLSKS